MATANELGKRELQNHQKVMEVLTARASEERLRRIDLIIGGDAGMPISLTRPAQVNALQSEMLAALAEIVDTLATP